MIRFLPELLLIGTGLFLLILDPFLPASRKSLLGKIALLGLVGGFLATLSLWGKESLLFGGLLALDGYALFFKEIFLSVTILTLLVSFRYLSLEKIPQGEYFALLLFATVGMMVMAAGTNLLSIYLGLEVMAISSYALVGLIRKDLRSLEGALKYFLLGAFNSGIILYGIALLYGATGSTDLSEIFIFFSRVPPSKMMLVGVALLVAGFGFKISAFPFHMWVPDAYEGSPTPIAGYLSVASKAASFAALLRVFLVALIPLQPEWRNLVILLSILTMTFGNLLAFAQESVKRMLAYSSIAHAGYLLIGLAVGNVLGVSAILFYFVAYALMNLGAFSMIVLLTRQGTRAESLEDFKGLANRHPVWGFCFLLFLLSLTGIPPSAGFVGKFYLLAGAIQTGLYGLALVAVLNSVVALAYYSRIARNMYMMEERRRPEISPSWALRFSLILLAILTLGFGLFPAPLFELVQEASQSIL